MRNDVMVRDIHLATVLGAHGLNGEVRTRLFASSTQALTAYGPVKTGDGLRLKVTSVRQAKPGEAIVTFFGVADRSAAEALKGSELLVDRDQLPPASESEFYHADLVGLSAFDPEDRKIGEVTAIHNFGAGDVIEISRNANETLMLAFTKETIPAIDVAAGRLTVAVPDEVDARKMTQ